MGAEENKVFIAGNLTKHILKHHKQEQNAYIGKDDIIIKKVSSIN